MAGSERDEPDPLTRAMARPDAGQTARVHAVGVGPGDPDFLTGRARECLTEADVVVGFETVVDVVRDVTDADLLTCGYDDEAETLATFGDRVAGGDSGVAVLMGDPNVSGYQFLGRVEGAVEGPVRVVPGISSVQLAASRARTPIERSTVVSLHRRGSVEHALDRLVAGAGVRHLIAIPRPYDWMPEDVAAHLLEGGADPHLSALVCERLTLEGETVTESSLGELAGDAGGDGPDDTAFSDLSVLVVRSATASGTEKPVEGQ